MSIPPSYTINKGNNSLRLTQETTHAQFDTWWHAGSGPPSNLNVKDSTQISQDSLLHILARLNNARLIEHLQQCQGLKKEELDAQNWLGLTPLHVAVGKESMQAAEKLIELKASVNKATFRILYDDDTLFQSSTTPLWMAIHKVAKLPLVKLLVRFNARASSVLKEHDLYLLARNEIQNEIQQVKEHLTPILKILFPVLILSLDMFKKLTPF